MTRYHPLLVALHWLMAIMILMALVFGKFALAPLDNADPQKIEGLTGHMSIGLMIGALLALRLLTRLLSQNPPHAETGTAILDRIGAATHWLFYLLIAMMVGSGIGTALSGGLFPIVFQGSGAPLPANLSELPPRLAHGAISNLLILLIALHFAAALYHQFILRDGLLRRMWFGKRTTGS